LLEVLGDAGQLVGQGVQDAIDWSRAVVDAASVRAKKGVR